MDEREETLWADEQQKRNARTFTFQELAEEARREVKQRQHVYPRLVQNNRLSPQVMDRRIAMMQAIADILATHAKDERLL